MSRALLFFVVLTSTLAAGCAGNRDNLAEPSTAAASTATATPATTLAAAPAAQATPDGTTVVDGNLLAARSADTLVCRDLLVRGSNQMRRQCGTAAQWKTYERREAELAGEMLRRMQNARPDPDYPQRRR
jgi:uncharacterized protein YdeI (BOF family)